MMKVSVARIDRLELALASRPWPFGEQRRAEIDDHFTKLQKDKPALWNGGILLLHDYAIAGTLFRGELFETDYASFLAWRDWDIPDATVKNCISMGAIKGADGGFSAWRHGRPYRECG
jgi:hypothetical protein